MAGVAQLFGHHPANQKVTGSIPGQGTCRGCRFGPHSGCVQEATDQCFSLSLTTGISMGFISPYIEIHKRFTCILLNWYGF